MRPIGPIRPTTRCPKHRPAHSASMCPPSLPACLRVEKRLLRALCVSAVHPAKCPPDRRQKKLLTLAHFAWHAQAGACSREKGAKR